MDTRVVSSLLPLHPGRIGKGISTFLSFIRLVTVIPMNVRGIMRLYRAVRSVMLSAANYFVKHVLRNKILFKSGLLR